MNRYGIEKKIKSEKGETLVETLYAVVVISLAFLILCGAVIATARLNASVKKTDVAFNPSLAEGNVTKTTMSINIDGETVTVDGYETENGYYYYEPQTGNP